MNQSMRIADLPDAMKPRERLARLGAESLNPEELIAILLRVGTQGTNVVEVAANLLTKYDGSLCALAQADVPDLCTIKGIGRDKAIGLKAAFSLARRMAGELVEERTQITAPETVAQIMAPTLMDQPTETLYVLNLNTRAHLISMNQISSGTLDTILVHPREVFRNAIAASAHSVILVHNHPSGDPTPSEADIRATRDIIRAGRLIRIEVNDHVIIGRKKTEHSTGFTSLRELGYFFE